MAAIAAGLASEHIVLGIGWYIAIAQPPGYVAMALGILYGGFVLPEHHHHSREEQQPR